MITLSDDKRPVVLCVDDEQSILKSLQRLFINSEVDLLLTDNGFKALELMRTQRVNVIITDMRMPNMTGAEFLAQAAKIQPDAYRILMTGHADLASTISAINLGKIHRYIQKPWENKELLAALDEGLALYRLVRQNKLLTAKVAAQNKQLKEMNHSLEEMVHQRTAQLKNTLAKYQALAAQREKEEAATLEVLYNIISSYPPLSGELARKISSTCENIAKVMQLPKEQLVTVRKAGLFCEIGKIALPPNIASSVYAKLDGTDRRHFCEHPQHAEEILLPATHLADVSLIIANQLERFNGAGEPAQKVGTDIPLGARILAVARDLWLITDGFQDGKKVGLRQAFESIKLHQGSNYDPDVVMALSVLLQKNELDTTEKIRSGLEVTQLRAGMKLKNNLYNKKHILLLPKDHIITQSSLDKLLTYQMKHKEILLVAVDIISLADSEEE
ncbi:Response regulator c-di-GMP phosphodiesterase, RpfG family, contains REC and HD-GYP domains [Arsukibacterium tuosuense]|uniref:Response regulator c-di-GMP phosphodiesterase, RpfG family, contains REC and HD-GYP domains n=1 Tax=Arsukibacterium tuosuense TaxID=1323745 RepID=A0A285JJ66_9GAMM|nr:HD domain-containing phosphohydrolase [Arsukibacterium tuosuense]SNY60324.1 Response regulator c-di-GMP phosphodiesterase, RpfG family, contains REC and HD-GYP domains [Arsukibacterium tuosuense]